MFKKTKIAAVSAAILGLSSMAAQAVSLNDAGSEGQVLVFPYYNVDNNYVTLYNIVNTTGAYKALKLRFRESENSNDVLDFNVYLSPFDVFTLNLTKAPLPDLGVVLKTADKSCTHPAIPADGVLFRHTAYASTDVRDVREGYLEVIEMGELNEHTTIDDGSEDGQLIASEGVLHEQPNGVPFDCTVIDQAWQQGVFLQGGARSNIGPLDSVDADSPTYPEQNIPSDIGFYGQSTAPGLTEPTGGIVGTSILVDVANVAGFVVEPASLTNYSTRAQHYLSSDESFYLLPSLASGNVNFARDNGDVATYSTTRRDWGLDDIEIAPRSGVPSGINPMPVADALLVEELSNQYFLGPNTLTDWVVSTPMRKHAIYNDYKYHATGVGYDEENGDILIDHLGVNNDRYWEFLPDAVDVNASFSYYNREEGKVIPIGDDFSPPILTPNVRVPLVREVNILAFTHEENPSDSVLGSANAQGLRIDEDFINGWGTLQFNQGIYDLAGSRYDQWIFAHPRAADGVPVIGFMAARAGNGAGGNVGETFPHFYKK